MDAINREELRSDPDFLIGQFRFLAARRHAATDPATFDLFVRNGASAAEAGDAVALLHANQELYRLEPFSADEGDQATALAGLRR